MFRTDLNIVKEFKIQEKKNGLKSLSLGSWPIQKAALHFAIRIKHWGERNLNVPEKLKMSLRLDEYATIKPHLLTIRHKVFQRLRLPVVTGHWPLGVTSIIVTTNEFTAIPLPVEVLQLLKRKTYNDCSPESC